MVCRTWKGTTCLQTKKSLYGLKQSSMYWNTGLEVYGIY